MAAAVSVQIPEVAKRGSLSTKKMRPVGTTEKRKIPLGLIYLFVHSDNPNPRHALAEQDQE